MASHLAAQGAQSAPFLNIERVFFFIYTLGTEGLGGSGILATLAAIMAYVQPIGFAIAALLAVGIVYCTVRLNQIRRDEQQRLYGSAGIPEPYQRDAGEARNPRWQRVQSLISSETDSDWRRAILEADIMLDEMLSNMGYAGESVGEKLKQIERSDFRTLDQAWEAHKARNQIAHEGEAYQLSQRQARRIIDQFEQVFQEFYYI